MSRLLVAQRALTVPGWAKDALWRSAQAVPSLDLRFADNKSLVDATTGASLVTFTRASTGTFVDSAGVLRSAVTNLLLRSEEFNNANWTASRISVTANAIAAPNGTLTADQIIEDTTATNTYNIAQTISFVSGSTYTVSVFAKATASPRFLQIQFASAAFTTNKRPVFDLVNGTAVAAADTTVDIQSIGDGWFRCVASALATTTVSTSVLFQLANTYTAGGGSATYTGDGASGLYLWGAQIEQSSTVGEYIPTTSAINSAPRFDHNPTTGESLGLLVEEARTNFLLQSQDFATTWGGANITIASDSTTAPDGTTTADTLTHVTAASERSQTSQSFTAGSAITVSIFAKKNTSDFFRFEIGNVVSCWFNLNTGVIGSNQAGSGNVLFSAKSIQPFPDGWYRCVLTCTTSTITTVSVKLFATNTDGNSSSINSSVYLWGAQLEAGAFATSYIPTTTATVTRAADVASITGANFSSWYNQTEGTVFAGFIPRTFAQACGLLSLDDGTTSERLQTRVSTAGNGSFLVADGGSVQANFSTTNSTSLNTKGKLATSFALNSFQACLNGELVASDTLGTLPTVTQAVIGNAVGAFIFNGPISRLTYWPSRFANTILQAISQP